MKCINKCNHTTYSLGLPGEWVAIVCASCREVYTYQKTQGNDDESMCNRTKNFDTRTD